jgi:tRNA-specific 2-thiouridylase
MYYTYGQNRNLNLGGNASRYFVCGKDVEKNILFVVDENNKNEYLSSIRCSLEQTN